MRRRDFIATGAVSATVAALGPSRKGLAMMGSSSKRLDRATFRSWLGAEFRLSGGSSLRSARATLVAVEDGPARRGLEQFSVVFGASAPLPTGLCWVSHADGTQFVLHLQGPPEGTRRRADFSLLESRHG